MTMECTSQLMTNRLHASNRFLLKKSSSLIVEEVKKKRKKHSHKTAKGVEREEERVREREKTNRRWKETMKRD